MGYRHWAGIGVKEVCERRKLRIAIDLQDCMTALDYYEGAAEKGQWKAGRSSVSAYTSV